MTSCIPASLQNEIRSQRTKSLNDIRSGVKCRQDIFVLLPTEFAFWYAFRVNSWD